MRNLNYIIYRKAKKGTDIAVSSHHLRLQVSIFIGYVRDAGTILCGVQVVMTDDQCAGVCLVKHGQQPPQSCFLLWCPRVGGLTADVQATLVAHADGVAVVVQAVGAYEPFRSTGLYLSVTTDDVVVAYAELPVVILPVPRIYLSCRRHLVWPHCTAVNDD